MVKKVISILLVLGIVFVGGYLTAKQLVPAVDPTSTGPKYATKPVTRGDIKQGVNITGQLNGNWGGSITAPKPEGITDSAGSAVTVEYKIEEVFVKPNQFIKQGESIVRLSTTNLTEIVEDLQKGIDNKRQEIQEVQESINSQFDTLSDMLNRKVSTIGEINPYDGIVITAPIRGRLSKLPITEGDRIEEANIATIVDDSKVKIPFKVNEVEYMQLEEGEEVLMQFRRIVGDGDSKYEVSAFDGFYKGKIATLNPNSVPNSDGISFIHNGTIEVENPGLIQPSMTAIIYRQQDGTPIESLTYTATVSSYVNEKKVYLTGIGSIGNEDAAIIATEVPVTENEFVEEGQILVRIAGEDVAKSIQDKLDAIKKDQDTIKTKNEEIEDIQKKIDKSNELSSKLLVTSPMDGMVSYVNYNVGDTINATSNSDQWELQLIDMYNTNEMNIYTTVSDLDVRYISQGAPVTITVDALPGETFDGEVVMLNQYTDRDGKTVYNVQISVVGREGLMPGMNTNCFVDSGEATDTLLVPIEAVFEEDGRQKVEVMRENGEIEVVEIEVGLMNDRQVEVLSGLEEGDQVVTGSTKDLMPSQSVPQNDSLLPTTGQ